MPKGTGRPYTKKEKEENKSHIDSSVGPSTIPDDIKKKREQKARQDNLRKMDFKSRQREHRRQKDTVDYINSQVTPGKWETKGK